MRPGPLLRSAFGPAEHRLTGLYRRFFIDLRRLAGDLARYAEACAILDLGCGEGQSTEALAEAFPRAALTGVDISERTGRLFRGDGSRVRFIQQELTGFATRHQGEFDIALICDVLHHLPANERADFVRASAACVKAGGLLVVKEWERRPNIPHLLCYLSDRFLTGDRVAYASADELRGLLNSVAGVHLIRETRVAPWRNNLALWSRLS